jgi:hypothetical protein
MTTALTNADPKNLTMSNYRCIISTDNNHAIVVIISRRWESHSLDHHSGGEGSAEVWVRLIPPPALLLSVCFARFVPSAMGSDVFHFLIAYLISLCLHTHTHTHSLSLSLSLSLSSTSVYPFINESIYLSLLRCVYLSEFLCACVCCRCARCKPRMHSAGPCLVTHRHTAREGVCVCIMCMRGCVLCVCMCGCGLCERAFVSCLVSEVCLYCHPCSVEAQLFVLSLSLFSLSLLSLSLSLSLYLFVALSLSLSLSLCL